MLLSCHSQGSVLGAAVLLQVETAVSARTSFLTYGSPLARLYGGFFPAYVSPAALERLGGFLADGAGPVRHRTGATWRWRNLYRPSDPIGGAVFCVRDLVAADRRAAPIPATSTAAARPGVRPPARRPVLPAGPRALELLRRPGLHRDGGRLARGRAAAPPLTHVLRITAAPGGRGGDRRVQ